MKKLLLLPVLLLLFAQLSYAQLSVLTTLHPRPQSSYLKSSGGTFKLGPLASVVISDSAPATTMKAVQYLERMARQIIGDTMPVYTFSQLPKNKTDRIFIGEWKNFPQLRDSVTIVSNKGEMTNRPEGYT